MCRGRRARILLHLRIQLFSPHGLFCIYSTMVKDSALTKIKCGFGRIVEDMLYGIRRTTACVDYSHHHALTLVNPQSCVLCHC
jgi:hypothetical protein